MTDLGSDGATVQVQARALGDPTRHRVFELLTEADGPLGVAELTEALGVNHNAVRQHLAKLVAAGLVIEGTATSRRPGRPRLLYRIDPRSDARWGQVGPYERLALLLVEVIRGDGDPVEVGRRAGLRQRMASGPHDAPVDALVDQMARLGFDPEVQEHDGAVDVTLRSCPFASGVLADPDLVCGLHLGLAEGIAASLGDIEIEELVTRDPRRAGCRLRCRPTAPAA